ncbi:hypothetical protein [Cellulophaga sp. HaHaR_3_176]|uniref:hypothetical protein n=1 Tax=Cellulophaga sp. HaHaR_3_176 TaxID=1942464 RepID=UPI0020B139AD|nr:hypothetical protein [Cellulophaga sp. HaHaR_3_176]
MNYYKSSETTRGDLQMKEGDEVRVNCTKCSRVEKKHINNIEAVIDMRLIILGIALGIFSTLILLGLYGAIGMVSFAIPILMWLQESNAVNGFNKYTIRRK